jgi:hypothetical protein
LTIYIISDQRWYSIQCFCSFFCRCGITHLHQPRQSSVTKDLAKGEAVSIRTAKCLNVTSGHTAHLESRKWWSKFKSTFDGKAPLWSEQKHRRETIVSKKSTNHLITNKNIEKGKHSQLQE